MTELPVRLFEDQDAWDAWLRKQGSAAAGVWLRIAKKAAALQSVDYQEALEVALCHGWIDGQKKAYDAESWLQKFTPRGPRSVWSKINRDKALALIKAGRMRPDGHAAIERAKKNRQWESAYDSHKTAEPAADFLKVLNQNAKARAFFATLTGSNRYAVLYRIQTAKKPETRQRRIDKFVQMLAKGEKLHP
ncbi:MAG: YdeI/OmpD-associated family protein [Vicinamibacterales bacterium]